MRTVENMGKVTHLLSVYGSIFVVDVEKNDSHRVEAWASITKKTEESDVITVVPMIIDPVDQKSLVPAHVIFDNYKIERYD